MSHQQEWSLGWRIAKARRDARLLQAELADKVGVDRVLAELAGWASISTAAHYVRRASTERVRNALGQREAL